MGRRFPKLQSLKEEHMKELLLLRRKNTGDSLPVKRKTYPKSKAQHVDVVKYVGHGENIQRVRNAHEPRKNFGLQTVTIPFNSSTKSVQRHNEAWKLTGQAYPGHKNWIPSGKSGARNDASRNMLEVRPKRSAQPCPRFLPLFMLWWLLIYSTHSYRALGSSFSV